MDINITDKPIGLSLSLYSSLSAVAVRGSIAVMHIGKELHLEGVGELRSGVEALHSKAKLLEYLTLN